MAESFKIPWFILSDGEPATIAAVNIALTAIGQTQIPNNPRIVVLPDEKNFEKYIVCDASKDTLIEIIVNHEAKNEQHREALKREWSVKQNVLAAIVEKLESNKTQYGAVIGKILAVPQALEELFKKIDTERTASPTTNQGP